MKLYLIRHGDADADIPEGLDDEARALTSRARQGLPDHFAALSPHLGQASLVLMSPLARAVQTATILAQTLRYEGSLRCTRALLPDGPVGAIDALLVEEGAQRVILVGHQPSMGAAAAHFLGLPSFPKPVQPGTVIGIERDSDPTRPGTLLLYAAVGQPPMEALPPSP